MYLLIVYIIISLILGLAPSIIWYRKYGKVSKTGDLVDKKKTYRSISSFGMLFFAISFLSLSVYLDIAELESLQYIPVLFLISNRLFFEPYYKAKDVADIEDLCLYLRPFKLSAKDEGYFAKSVFLPESVEKLLCGKLRHSVAPCFCIGNPNSVVHTTLISSNVFASDDEWQCVVDDLARKSKIIILRVLDTEGCLWEIDNCLKKYLNKTVFLIAGGDNEMLFKQNLSRLNIEIPEIDIAPNSCNAIYLDENLIRWNNSILRNSRDMDKFIDSYLGCHQNLYEEVRYRSSFWEVLKRSVKQKNINKPWIQWICILLQPLWYAVLNNWPMKWSLVALLYWFVLNLLLGFQSVLSLFILLPITITMMWIAPRVTRTLDVWGGERLIRKGNREVLKWIFIYFCLMALVLLTCFDFQ